MAKESKGIFDYGLTITLLTASMYCFAYLREVEICEYYKIPKDFITISISDILSLDGNLLDLSLDCILIGSTFFLTCFTIFGAQNQSIKTNASYLTSSGLTIFFLWLTIYNPNLSIWWILFWTLLPAFIIGGILWFVIPKSSTEALENLKQRLNTKYLMTYGRIIAIGMLCSFVTGGHEAGRYAAINSTDFSIILTTNNNEHDLIVLRKYGDYLFCRPYFPLQDSIGEGIVMIKMPDANKELFLVDYHKKIKIPAL